MDLLGVAAVIAAVSTLVATLTATVVAFRVLPRVGEVKTRTRTDEQTSKTLPPTSAKPAEAVAHETDGL